VPTVVSWLAGHRLIGVLVALGLMGVLALAMPAPMTSPQASAAPSGAASEAPVAVAPPVTARVTRNDIVLTLAVDHARATAGERLRARIEIANVGFRPVSWTSGGCGILNGFSLIGPDVPQPPPGRDWEGTAHWAKWSATTGGVSMVGFADARAVDRGPPFSFACTADLRIDDIGPGQTLTADVVWPGRSSDGQPAPGGVYTLSYEFPYLAPVAKEQYRGDAAVDRKPIPVQLAFRIDPGRPVAIPSTLAFDTALADPRVATWIAGVTREQLYGATVGLQDGLWRISIEAEGGKIDVSVDSSSGGVREVDAHPR
jgi:hypothetical protein